MMKLMLLIAGFLLAGQLAKAQQCEETEPTRQGPIYPRTINVMFSGWPVFKLVNRDTLQWAMGTCGKVEDLVPEMLEHFASYGVHVPELTKNPFQNYASSDVVVNIYRRDPDDNYRVVSETFYNYAKFRNTPLIWLVWTVWVKDAHTGPGGTAPAEHTLRFGLMRYRASGQDFCMPLRTSVPIPSVNPAPFDLLVSNKHLGEGAASGVAMNTNGTIDIRFTIRFPGTF